MAVNLNWGAAQQPNPLMQLYQGQQDGQQNALMQLQMERQRNADRREDLTFQQQQAAAERLAKARSAAVPFIAKGDYRGAAGAEAVDAPELAAQHLEIYSKLSEQDRKISDASDGIIASAYPTLKAMPQGSGQRKAFWDSQVAPQLKQLGAPAEVVDSFDPDNQAALDARYAHAIGAKGMLEQGNADRTFGMEKDKFGYQQQHDAETLGLQRDQFGEVKRHNQADEGLSGARVGLERQRVGLEAQRVGIERTKAGTERAAAQQKLTEGQAKDGFSAKRLAAAQATLGALESKPGFNPTMAGVGSVMAGVVGHGVGDDSRSYGAAKREWADSIIRLTTGAAATKDELDNADQTYFPQYGDSPAIIDQKSAARRRIERDAAYRAGPGANPTPGAPPAAAAPSGVIRYDAQGNRVR